MNTNFNYLFQYLVKEDISLDKSEFLFQIQSHPDQRSLLSITDTLSFFNIDNVAIRIEFTDIELLPNRFITLLHNLNSNPELCFIEKKENNYFITTENKTVKITLSELEKNWSSIVLLVEKDETEVKTTDYSWLSWIFPTICFFGFILTLLQFNLNLYASLFFIFPVIGTLLSFAALKDLFGAKSKLINNFCNITASTSCESIINSDKWKQFYFFNFSDLSIVFFSSQVLVLLALALSGNSLDFFKIQSVLLIGSIPILLLSLYFQKFVEKKWCPICLLIIIVVILEIFYLHSFLAFNFSLKSFILSGFIFLLVSIIWLKLKKQLTDLKNLKENQLNLNRFVRNYEVFKNILISNGKSEIPNTPIILGNKESKIILTIITNPFCTHCKEVHQLIERILDKYNDIQISLVLKVDMEYCDTEVKLFFRTLLASYLDEGQRTFRENLNSWYTNNNIKTWLQNHKEKNIDVAKIDGIYNDQNNQCSKLGYNFTPVIFINGYEYPKLYERNSLYFFVNELIEDQTI